ncbi:Outer membrane protein OmpA [Algoriphagus alkaliphilus]|uniref:Outer membrane protein OmpA n=3 Tax=Algoriphagus TaxID=246875 RepID=A0A1G5ZRB7_9BACT|nr:Outer membrane protein OmpA [Algoriphagus alkaliphilus]
MVLIMKKTLTILGITAVLFLGAVYGSEAQQSKVRYADDQMGLMNYQHALDMYKEAYAKKPNYETARKTALAQEKVRDYGQSYAWWKTAVGYEEATEEAYTALLRMGILTDNFEEAKSIIEAKGLSADSLGVSPASIPVSARKLKVEPMEGVNSSEADFSYVEDAKGMKYFVSDRGGSFPTRMPGIRIDGRNKLFSEEKSDASDRNYFSVYQQDKDGKVSKVVSNVPNTMHFSDPSYGASQNLLFYSVTRSIGKVKKRRNIVVQPEIYYSKVGPDGSLEGFTAFPYNDSIGYAMMHPFVDEGAKRLYFSSDMPGGMGGYDLYYSEYDENMVFGTPVNLGPEVNTGGNETHPFRKDNRFYFSSTGHKGLGGMDIFEANYTPTAISGVRNMGTPVNSLGDDFAYREGKDRTVYLSSNRKGGQGLDDIYMAKEMYKQFLARVLDCNGAIITESYLATFRDKTQGIIVPTARNGKGELTAQVEPESDFGITISKPGYFPLTDESITTKGFAGDTLKREYRLVPIPYQLPVHVDIVYYDLDKFAIRRDAMPALDKLAELMKKYSFLDLLVASHTDSRASDEYNITLSNNRAKAVTEYLGGKGINSDRVRLEWFGESQLTNDCGNGKPCKEENHQLNRRSELVLEAFPDPTKQYDIPQELKDMDFCEPEDIFEKIQEEINDIPTIYFDFDKAMLRSVHKTELERTAIMLKRMPNLMLYIEGHTDQRGDGPYNQKLSERRAQAVKDYLKNKGVEDNRLESQWFGKTKPIHDCDQVTCTPAMHQLNRRTELRVGKSSYGYTGRQKKVDTM